MKRTNSSKALIFRRVMAMMIAFACAISIAPSSAFAKQASKKSDETTVTEVSGYRDVILSNGFSGTENTYEGNYFAIGDHGLLTFSKICEEPECPPELTQTQAEDEFKDAEIKYTVVEGEQVVDIDEKTHNYTLLAGGKAVVNLEATVTVDTDGTDIDGNQAEPETVSYTATYTFCVMSDLSGVKLEKDAISLCTVPKYGQSTASTTVVLMDCPNIEYNTLTYKLSNKKVKAKIYVNARKKVLDITVSGKGTAMATLTINGTEFKLKITAKKVSINKDTCFIDKGKSVKLKLKGYGDKVAWKSSKKSVATVSSAGTVKGKKIGTTIVYADVENVRIGCAVSVVKKGMTKVVKRAIKIGATCKYSQPRRMQRKYYDCSSLVWRSYKLIGKYFGLRYWAPTAADEARWCSNHKKLIGKFKWKKFKKFYYRPGDVLFRVGAKNGRYRGIYHIEMFAGYRVVGFDDEGKPYINMVWANRPDNYYDDCYGDIFGRP